MGSPMELLAFLLLALVLVSAGLWFRRLRAHRELTSPLADLTPSLDLRDGARAADASLDEHGEAMYRPPIPHRQAGRTGQQPERLNGAPRRPASAPGAPSAPGEAGAAGEAGAPSAAGEVSAASARPDPAEPLFTPPPPAVVDLTRAEPVLPLAADDDALGRDEDDLRMIEGLGPRSAEALRAAGIRTFAALAEATEEQVVAALRSAGLRRAATAGSWPAQARLLAPPTEAPAEPA